MTSRFSGTCAVGTSWASIRCSRTGRAGSSPSLGYREPPEVTIEYDTEVDDEESA